MLDEMLCDIAVIELKTCTEEAESGYKRVISHKSNNVRQRAIRKRT